MTLLRDRRITLYENSKISVRYSHRPPTAYMGRFGGGWQWQLGFEASAGFRSVIVSLLVFSIRLTRKSIPAPIHWKGDE